MVQQTMTAPAMMRFRIAGRGERSVTLSAVAAMVGPIAAGRVESDPEESLIRWCPRRSRSM